MPILKAIGAAEVSGLARETIVEHGFALHKGAFHDALALRYGWIPSEMPSMCTCGSKFSVEHALSCAKGGFPSIRHNEIRNLTATEVCHDVCIEPGLQPVSNETLTGASANRQDGARLDIAANGFWGGTFERTRIFHLVNSRTLTLFLPNCLFYFILFYTCFSYICFIIKRKYKKKEKRL